jgi:hypothetical protein
MLSPLDHVSMHRTTPNSNAALLLPLFVPVTPLLRYSYKKIGGVPHPVGKDDLFEAPRGCSPAVAGHPIGIDDTNPQCFLSLTDFPRLYPQKDPNVFYHLQTTAHLTTSVFYHLQKRGVGGIPFGYRPDRSLTD